MLTRSRCTLALSLVLGVGCAFAPSDENTERAARSELIVAPIGSIVDFPQLIGEAQAEERRRNLVKRWVDDWVDAFLQDAQDQQARWGFGNFYHTKWDYKENKRVRVSDCGTISFRRIAAVLTAVKDYKDVASHMERRSGVGRASIVDMANRWIQTVAVKSLSGGSEWVAGTGLPGYKQDYDMCMKEQVALLYQFKDERGLLSDASTDQLVHNLEHYTGQDAANKLMYSIGALGYPETENHVMMIYSSKYLTNQWIYQNPRATANVSALRAENPARYNNDGGDVEDLLLQAAGRIVHNGFFETNGRPYQTFTVHALMNLYNYAASPKVKTAAHNALDYATTKYAFQSLQSRRLGPTRRNCQYAGDFGIYNRDGMNFMMGALSGAYKWPENFHDGFVNASGHALWAMLGSYRLHPAVHDFMHNKYNGYWARMQARYTELHYQEGAVPRYFTENGSNLSSYRQIEPAPELYFVTNDFINTSGGGYNRYRIFGDNTSSNSSCGSDIDAHVYDFLARPQTLMFAEHYPLWSNYDEMAGDILAMPGYVINDSNSAEKRGNAAFLSRNTATYKNFSYGFRKTDGGDSRCGSGHDYFKKPPFDIPASWPSDARYPSSADEWVRINDHGRFAVYDLSKSHNVYVVLFVVGRYGEGQTKFKCFKRGFWEVIPAKPTDSLGVIANKVRQLNPASHFPNGLNRPYRYTMATTEETLELDDDFGFLEDDKTGCRPGILSITDKNGHDVPLAANAATPCDASASQKFPLLEVRQVAPDFTVTAVQYAYAEGDGRMFVYNPHRGKKLEIDSRDYRNPKRKSSDL